MAITCTNPIDVVKTRLQLQGEPGSANARRYRGIAHAFATIARAEGAGLRGLQRGLPPACLLQFSNVSMRFGGYAALTAALDIDPAESAAGWFGSLALGASSGFMAACVSNPFFLLKTRAQAIGGGSGGGSGSGSGGGSRCCWLSVTLRFGTELGKLLASERGVGRLGDAESPGGGRRVLYVAQLPEPRRDPFRSRFDARLPLEHANRRAQVSPKGRDRVSSPSSVTLTCTLCQAPRRVRRSSTRPLQAFHIRTSQAAMVPCLLHAAPCNDEELAVCWAASVVSSTRN
jgi:hypothetical protein